MSWPAPVLAAVKPGPIVVAVAILAVLAWRWGRLSTANRVLSLLAAAGLGVYGAAWCARPAPRG